MTRSGRWLPMASAAALALLLLPPVRQATESTMFLHMAVQAPWALLAGAGLAEWRGSSRRRPWQRALYRCNELGMAGLLGSALTLALLMVPRLLDLALQDGRIEALKLLALVLSGAALRVSWPRAGSVLQAFYLGNVLPMMAVVGTLYQESANRVCNAYLLGDQQRLGQALVVASVALALAWLSRLAWTGRARGAGGDGAPAPPWPAHTGTAAPGPAPPPAAEWGPSRDQALRRLSPRPHSERQGSP